MFNARSFQFGLRWVCQGAVLMLLFVTVPVVIAEGPCVHFDVPEVVACRARVDESFLVDHPDEMLIEARFDVSSLIRVGREEDLSQYLYVIESPERSLKVADYSPKTELITSLAGNVGVQRHSESSSNLGVNASVAPHTSVSANGAASVGRSSGTKFNYDLLPPKQLLSASGTIARGTAVYYKLKSSRQTSMDGVKRFEVIFRVPSAWRGDHVRLRCAAYHRSSGDKQQPICGSSDFLVGLYLLGDDAAETTVTELTKADRRLRHLAKASQETIDRQRFPSVTDKIGSIFNVSRPRIPEDWFERVIRSEQSQSFERHLPEELRDALRQYRKARQSVRELSQPADAVAAIAS